MVCEGHPDRPYDDELGCACSEGTPCACNDSTPPDTSQIIVISACRQQDLTLRMIPAGLWAEPPVTETDLWVPFGPLWPFVAVLRARMLVLADYYAQSGST
jgi:hypothetical protein